MSMMSRIMPILQNVYGTNNIIHVHHGGAAPAPVQGDYGLTPLGQQTGAMQMVAGQQPWQLQMEANQLMLASLMNQISASQERLRQSLHPSNPR